MTPDLERHLSGCSRCAALLEAHQRSIANLDAEIANALAVPVPNTFMRDVRARVEQEQHRSAWWLSWGIVPAAAAILLAVWLRPVAIETPALPVAPLPNWPVSRAATIVPDPTPVFVETVAAPRQLAKALPKVEVIVPPDSGRAVSVYLQLVRQAALDTSNLARSSDVIGVDLQVAPLTIAPIILSDVEIGSKPTVGGPGTGPRGF
jgi:anti-sigma factor RsiW